MAHHPAVEAVLQYFEYRHLPSRLQEVSRPLHDLAYQMADTLPQNPELTVGLRKLLEAKDCFVRAALTDPDTARSLVTETVPGTEP